jgi:predicted aldo/keto reductase-like oxidoreductase
MPKSGDMLSILGFGCMRLPVKEEKIDEARAISQIRLAIDSGVNYLDTAWPYHGGASEPLLAKALCEGYRERVKIATKLPSWLIASRQDMDRYLAAQLGKLGTDHIDYYLLHGLNGPSWDHLEGLGAAGFMQEAVRDGRILNAGFSFHGLVEDFRRIVDAIPWDFCQIQYNYLDQENQAGTAGLEYAAAKDLGVVVMEPLRGGNLGLAPAPPAVQTVWDEAPTRRTPAEWALRWVWNRPEVTVVLSGMNEEGHIAENLRIADSALPNSLTADELQIVERARHAYQHAMPVDCTGCGYCMPCPSDVLIPGCFETFNKMRLFGQQEMAKFSYILRMSGLLSDGKPKYASQCVQCGECVDKCPQNIQIPDMLAQVAAEMEDAGLEQRLALARKLFHEQLK